MNYWIGEIAGKIYNQLKDQKNHKMELAILESKVSEHEKNMTEFEYNMALGWLLRENNIKISSKNDSKVVELLKK